MKRIAILAVAALSLASCSATTGSIDTAIQKSLPQICSAAATAHSAFVIVASTGDLKQSTIKRETAAWTALEVVCRDPSSVTAATALVKAAEAYAAITLALREAKNVEG